MFSSNVTPMKEYKKAKALHAYINLDDYTHIDFLEKGIGVPETICCRYNPGGVFELGTDIMDNPGEAKYGFTKEQLIDGYQKLMKLGVKNFGLHSFIASNTVGNEYYPTLAGILFRLAVELKEKTGANITFINLSGGVGIPYTPDKEPNDIKVIGEGVREQFEKILVPAGLGDVAIFTELGRFMLAPYGQLVTKCIHQKHIYKEYIGLNTCACDLMRPAMYGAYHHITVLGKENEPCDHKYDVTGGLYAIGTNGKDGKEYYVGSNCLRPFKDIVWCGYEGDCITGRRSCHAGCLSFGLRRDDAAAVPSSDFPDDAL